MSTSYITSKITSELNIFLNPFSHTIENQGKWFGRILRSSFKTKMLDTLKVFSGGLYYHQPIDDSFALSIGKNEEHGAEELQYFDDYRMGIFDYIALGIPFFLKKFEYKNIGWFSGLCAVLSAALEIPRYLFAGLLTLISAIPVGLFHLGSNKLRSSYEDKLINNVSVYGSDKKSIQRLSGFLKQEKCGLESLLFYKEGDKDKLYLICEPEQVGEQGKVVQGEKCWDIKINDAEEKDVRFALTALSLFSSQKPLNRVEQNDYSKGRDDMIDSSDSDDDLPRHRR